MHTRRGENVMNIEKMKIGYGPKGVPEILLRVIEISGDLDGSFSADFSFTDAGPDLTEGLPNSSNFAPFGGDGCGGFWASWEPRGLAINEDSPIVYISGEAVMSTPVCSSLREFFSLLAIGCEDLGDKVAENLTIQFSDECHGANTQNAVFRDCLKRKLGIDPPVEPEKLVAVAKSRFGESFISWYRLWQDEAPWSKIL